MSRLLLTCLLAVHTEYSVLYLGSIFKYILMIAITHIITHSTIYQVRDNKKKKKTRCVHLPR